MRSCHLVIFGTYAQNSLACLSTLRPFDTLRAGKLRAGRLRGAGSMVLFCVLFFRPAGRKNNTQKVNSPYKISLRSTPLAAILLSAQFIHTALASVR